MANILLAFPTFMAQPKDSRKHLIAHLNCFEHRVRLQATHIDTGTLERMLVSKDLFIGRQGRVTEFS